MTEVILDRLKNALRTKPRKLDELHALAIEAGSDWSKDQLWLLLACLDGFRVEGDEGDASPPTVSLGDRSPKEKLQDAILDVVRSEAGRPVPVQRVLSRLPSEFVTSVAQILAVAREAPNLEVFGPGLLRLKR
jgi:hypothetical protein